MVIQWSSQQWHTWRKFLCHSPSDGKVGSSNEENNPFNDGNWCCKIIWARLITRSLSFFFWRTTSFSVLSTVRASRRTHSSSSLLSTSAWSSPSLWRSRFITFGCREQSLRVLLFLWFIFSSSFCFCSSFLSLAQLATTSLWCMELQCGSQCCTDFHVSITVCNLFLYCINQRSAFTHTHFVSVVCCPSNKG